MKRFLLALALGASALGLSSCTFQPGVAFGTLTGATLDTRFEPPASRLESDGRLKTDTGYRITVDSLRVSVRQLDFMATSGSPAAASTVVRFDPSNPPPGYTLCHGGHCHRSDGELVPYEVIEAELSGGGAPLKPVLSLPVEKTFDLASGSATTSLSECEPGCQLDRGTWSQVRLLLASVTATGSVEDPTTFNRLGGVRRDWSLTLTPETFTQKVDITIDRAESERLALVASFALTERLWDAIDFKSLAASPGVLVLDAEAGTLAQLTENLAKSSFSVTVTR